MGQVEPPVVLVAVVNRCVPRAVKGRGAPIILGTVPKDLFKGGARGVSQLAQRCHCDALVLDHSGAWEEYLQVLAQLSEIRHAKGGGRSGVPVSSAEKCAECLRVVLWCPGTVL